MTRVNGQKNLDRVSLVSLIVGCLCATACSPPPASDPPEKERMAAYIRSLYEPGDVRHSFRMASGVDIDCVDMLHQPGMRRKEMQGQSIQAPVPLPKLNGSKDNPDHRFPAGISLTGDLDDNGAIRKCPAQTVPIRRVKLDDMLRFSTLENFHQKSPGEAPLESGNALKTTADAVLHEYAVGSQSGVPNYGSHSVINLWSPYVDTQYSNKEFSLSQIWVARGDRRLKTLQTLEVGAQVFPNKYGDSLAHLFIYSTSDGYSGDGHDSGCYNLECGRFVQTSGDVVIGATFFVYSAVGDRQSELDVTWLQQGGNWWLYLSGEPIGYYPGSLFNDAGVRNFADQISYGGEVINDKESHSWHTTTKMGSDGGAFPPAGLGYAAYQRGIYYYDLSMSATLPSLSVGQINRYCYDISDFGDDALGGKMFFFGGIGYSPICL